MEGEHSKQSEVVPINFPKSHRFESSALGLFKTILLILILAGCATKIHTRGYDTYFNSKNFNGQAFISIKDKPLYQRSFGFADIENKKTAGPNDTYLVGSLTKQFTGLGILLLEEKGLLSTGNIMQQYFPALPDKWQQTTIHELLTHSSGLPDFEDIATISPASFYDADTLVKALSGDSIPFFNKGKFRYSNISYMLLSGIIEKVSGLSYCAYLQKNIFAPLQMTNTGCIADGKLLSTIGYEKGGEGILKRAPFSINSYSVGAGNLYSTINDLVIWNRSIRSRKIISENVYKKWFTHHVLVEDESEYEDKGDYTAYGWFVSKEGEKAYHLGGVTGYKTSITRYPGSDILILTISNVEDKYSNQIRMEFPKLVYQNVTNRK